METNRISAASIRGTVLTAAILGVLVCCLAREAQAATVYGLVRDPDGNPVRGKSFVVLGAQGDTLKSVTTDAAGRYSVFLKPGIYRVRIGPSWEATVQSLTEPSKRDIRFIVKPARRKGG